MRRPYFILAGIGVLLLAGCQTTVTTSHIRETEMTEGPARVVNAEDIEEGDGVTSKPVEPEKTEGTAGTAPAEPPAGEDSGSTRPSAFESDKTAAEAQEKEPSLFEPTRTADEVDSKKAKKLLDEMKPEAEKMAEARAKKMEELLSQVRKAANSDEKKQEAQKKFEEAEKLYAQKKHEEAVAAYRQVIELVPTHKEALARLTQCYGDMEEAGKAAKTIKKPATAQEMLLLEQKYASAVRLYAEDGKDEAFKKFKEIVEMIQWSSTKIDTKNILGKARDYIERIKIENELEGRPGSKKESKPEEKKPAQEKKEPGKPEEPKEPPKKPDPGDIAPY